MDNTRRKGRGFAAEWEPSPHLTDRAKAEYRRVVGLLRAAGVLGRTDPRLIELYATTYDLHASATERIARDGPTVPSAHGDTITAHPMIAVANAATIRLRAIIGDLGLTPKAGGVDAAGDGNPWDGLLSVTG